MSLMICPKAKECNCDKCDHMEQHEWFGQCNWLDIRQKKNDFDCPACIPYIQEQPKKPTCPECGHPVNAHTYDGCAYEPAVFCKCLRTRNQAMQKKDYCTSEWREYNCLDKETCPILSDGSICPHYEPIPVDLQPTQMPLREQLAELEHEQWVEWSQCIATTEKLSESRKERWSKLWIPYAELSETDKDHDRVWADKRLAILQAHDSAVASKAVKEFANTIISKITLGHFENNEGDLLEWELIQFCRAMAEEEM